jgi:replicative DNA helicase
MFDRTEIVAAIQRTVKLDIEQAFLAACITDNRQFTKASYLTSEDFAEPVHREIWRVGSEMARNGSPVSMATLLPRLEGDDEAVKKYIIQVAMSAIIVSGAPYYAEEIRDLSNRRQLIRLAESAMETATDFERSADEIIAGTVRDLQSLSDDGIPQGITTRQAAEAITEDLGKALPCFSTGLVGLDRAAGGGLYAGKLYGVAARKKVGKTLFLGSVSYNLNQSGIPHLFFTGEMSPKEIEQRNAARACGFNSIQFLTRDDPDLSNKVANYAVTVPNNVIYEHKPGATLEELRAMVSRHLAKRKIKGLIVDYLQLIGGKSKQDTEELHLRTVADWLARIAREENLFVLVAAQTNQDGNTRGGEGLRLACDMYFSLHREKDQQGAWLEMGESRYTLYQNVGNETSPGIWLDKDGPHFKATL